MKIERFEDSIAWQKARVQHKALFDLTQTCSTDWEYCRQIRKAALSVMNNTAEGFERFSLRKQHHFLTIAKGSAGEVRSMLYAGLDVGHLTRPQFAVFCNLAEEVSRLVASWRSALQRQIQSGIELREDGFVWDAGSVPDAEPTEPWTEASELWTAGEH